jgi:multidrug efflux pump subunit AcrB
MGTPFGFMAFLGVASLIGVIVSHVIVLFDFIEEMHEKGEPLERALPDAGIVASLRSGRRPNITGRGPLAQSFQESKA